MKKSEIGKAASALTREQFSDEISSFTQLTKQQIDALFPTQTDREELGTLVDVVLNAADENERKAKLVGNITKVAGAVVKLLQKSSLGGA